MPNDSADRSIASEVAPLAGGGGSRLGRLFLYSKDSKFAALENFTTEALAQAISDDPRPMLSALRQVARGSRACVGFEGIVTLRPATQVYVKGGFIDLVLDVVDHAGVARGTVWVEVKVGSPETGEQLDCYRLAATGRSRPTWLVTLGGVPLRADVPHLLWMELYQRARRTPAEHRSWRDLRRFLEEQMIATDALGPVTDREAGSIEAAFDLMQKAAAVVAAVHRELPGVFDPPLHKSLVWTSEATLLNAAAQNFRRVGAFAGFGGGVSYGIMAEEGTAYWFIAVTPERTSKVGPEGVRAAADGVLDPSVWDRPAHGPSVLVARARATALGDHAQVVAWFVQRLRELGGSRVVSLSLGIDPAGDAESR